MDLSRLSNEDLEKQLNIEISYYEKDLTDLCKTIRKTIPKRILFRIISKLYNIRKKKGD